MRPLHPADLEFLLEIRPGPCVSLYLPTEPSGRESAENLVRFKNLLRRAETELGNDANVLAPARALLDHEALWAATAEGLAVFVGGGVFGWFRVPLGVPEQVVVGKRFHVAPLLRLFAADGRFYLLTLSHQAVRLFEMTRSAARELDLGDIPRSLAADDAADKEELRHFLRRVDHGLLAQIEDRQPPLVLTGENSVQTIFRDLSGYPNLVREGLPGDLDEASPEQLRDRAFPLVEPLFARGLAHALARFERAAPGRIAQSAEAVVRAAVDGAVETLFVAEGPAPWGQWEADKRSLRKTPAEDPKSENLVDLAMAEVLARQGQVFVLAPGAMPVPTPLVALLRF